VVAGLVLAAVLGGAAEANPPATKPATPPTTKLPASPAPAASALTGTKEDNPLEDLAKVLGFPAGVLAVVTAVWFVFTQGKPIQENRKAWSRLLGRRMSPVDPTPPPISPHSSEQVRGDGNTTITDVSAGGNLMVSPEGAVVNRDMLGDNVAGDKHVHLYPALPAELRSSVQVTFVNGPSQNKLIKKESVRTNPDETVTFIIATHFMIITALPIEISDIELLYPQIDSASPSCQEMKADNCPIEFDYSYRMKTRLNIAKSADILLQREFISKSYLLDENVYGKVFLRIKYISQSTSGLRVIEARGTLRPGGEMQDITIHNEIILDGGYF